jgi:hypothetical protein
MQRRRLAVWLSSIPVMVAGSQLAHVLAYRLVYPSAHVRLASLLATGHQYMLGTSGYLPLLLGVLGAVELVGVGWVFAGSFRRSLQRPVPAWAFALLPVLAFTLQEFLERILAGSSFPWWLVLQPTFQIGIALQLPIALIAYLVARLLLRTAREAALALEPYLAVRVGACADPPLAACGQRSRAACGPAYMPDRPVRGPPPAQLALS